MSSTLSDLGLAITPASTPIGIGSTAALADGTLIGGQAVAAGVNSRALAQNSNTTGAHAVAIGYGSVADRDNSVSLGAPGAERLLTHVADGVAPTDAVNKRQLDQIALDASAGIAGATAPGMIPQADPGRRFAIGAGIGSDGGTTALAVGGSARLTSRLAMRFGASVSGSRTAMGAGAALQW